MSGTPTAPDDDATTRATAAAMDTADPLARYRDRFEVHDPALAYLDGNSLGMLPAATLPAVAQVVAHQWGERLIRSWEEGWWDLPATVGDRLGTSLLGARPGETVVCDNVSVNVAKLLHAALDLRPGRHRILVDTGDFPTDRYVAAEVARRAGATVSWIGPLSPGAAPRRGPVRAADLVASLTEDVAVVLLSLVDYRSAAVADVAGITAAAHAVGALVMWDCSHAVGAVPLDLPGSGADLAVGCTYKYLCGGPGAPAWLWVNQAQHGALGVPALPGWHGHARPFEMGPAYEPAAGVRRYVTGSPSPLTLTAVDAGVALVAEAGMAAVRAKSELLTAYAVDRYDTWLAPLDVGLSTPREPAARGSHVLLTHPDALALCQALVDRQVIPDFRRPDGIRVGLAPLTTRFVDVHDGLAALRTILQALPA